MTLSEHAIQRCSLPKLTRWASGDVARCPDCGQWWVSRSHLGESVEETYGYWHHIGWLALHTRYRAQYKHWKGGGGDDVVQG